TFRVTGLETLRHKPIIVLYEVDPWLMVIGSDVPRVTVYEDGLAIMVRPQPKAPPERIVAHLTQSETKRLVSQLKGTGAGKLANYIDICGCEDGPTSTILFRSDSRWSSVSVYGVGPDGEAVLTNVAHRLFKPAPRAFIEAHSLLSGFRA